MKVLISEEQYRKLRSSLIETTEQEYEIFNMENEVVFEIFESIKNGQKIKFNLINPQQYKVALTEFMKYREFVRFPVKYIYQWKELIKENILLLSSLTEIHGHGQDPPFDEFYHVFDYSETRRTNQYNLFTGELEDETIKGEFSTWVKQKYEETGDKGYLERYNWNSCIEFLEEVYNIDDYVPYFSNGQIVLSDFGIEPLMELLMVLIHQDSPEDIIVTINKIFDVVHQRSDLSEIFIKGGAASLNYISNN